jgi:pilus assembly protein TadC
MTPAGWLLLAAGLVLLSGRPRSARHRAAVTGSTAVSRRTILPLLAGALTGLLLFAVAGRAALSIAPVIGMVAGLLVRRLTRLEQHRPVEPRAVAFVLELLAAALTTGAPVDSAIAGVAGAVDEQGALALRQAAQPVGRVGRLLRLGAEPTTAWSGLDSVPGMWQVAAAGRRCAHSGARLAAMLVDLAGDLRVQHRAKAVARAERTGVWALLPLGCCFLPAFVCLGVLPVMLGVAGQVLGHG